MSADVTVLILTKNEEFNLPHALESVSSFARRVVVVDSGSTDRTLEIAREAGADVYENEWYNYATQLNWGLDNTGIDTTWTFRLDADEVVRMPREVLEQICWWQLVLGYRLRELEAKDEGRRRLG